MGHIHLDFESCSALDLTKVGADVYSKHNTTSVLCLAYAVDSAPVKLWYPGMDKPEDLLSCVDSGHLVIGHNIGGFEVLIWNNICVKRYGWPPLKIENCRDTMAMAYSMAFPGSLEKAAAAAGMELQKDMKGRRTMLQLCKPKKVFEDGSYIWWEKEDYPEKYETLYEYCKTDVEVERELYKRLLPLSSPEYKLWLKDWEINRRGVQIDTKSLQAAIDLVAFEKKRLDKRIRQITNGQVAMCSATSQLRNWLIYRGLDVPSVAQADVIDMLKSDIPDDCRAALLLRQEAAKTSTAKLNAMLKGADSDGRIRGLFQYNGAATGRWAGRRIQLHNLPRPNLPQQDIENIFEILRKVDCGSGREQNYS